MSCELPGPFLQQQPGTSASVRRRRTSGNRKMGILKNQFQTRSEGNLSILDDDEDGCDNIQNMKKRVKFVPASPTNKRKIPSFAIRNSRGIKRQSFHVSDGSTLNRNAERGQGRKFRLNPYLNCDFYHINMYHFRCNCRHARTVKKTKDSYQCYTIVPANPSNLSKEPHLCRLWNFLLLTKYPRQSLFGNELDLIHLPQKDFYLLLMYLSTFTSCLAYKGFSASGSPSAADYRVLREMTTRLAQATEFPKSLRDSHLKDPMNSAKELFCQFFDHLLDTAEKKLRAEGRLLTDYNPCFNN